MSYLLKREKYVQWVKRLNEALERDEDFVDGRPVTQSLMDMESLEDINIDVFEIIKYKVLQVAYGHAISLLITGQGGLGKSYEVEKALQDNRKEFEMISGGITSAGLFEFLFKHNGELVIFDDCDSVFGNIESVNILKAALDTKPVRKITRSVKGHFDVKGMTEQDIIANFEGDESKAQNKDLFDPSNKGKMPKAFVYTGRVIFISNLSSKEIDPTIITRTSAHIDVNLTHDEVIERMRNVMRHVHKDVPEHMKEETLQLMDFLSQNYVTRHPLTIRGFVNAIETRVANDKLTKEIGGKKYPVWQLLIKQDMLGANAVRRKD